MNAASSESLSPLDEPQIVARRKRIAHLARMVFDLMAERYQGGTNHEFDGAEKSELIAALRVCSLYTDQIGCLPFDDVFVIQIEGIDGNNYIIQFSLFGPAISVHAARVRVTSLPLVGPDGHSESTYNSMDVDQEHSHRVKLGKVTPDRAFLVGMSLVIGSMDPQSDDDPDDDGRLAPLLAQVMPTDDELREIRTKLPPSPIRYADEGDWPR